MGKLEVIGLNVEDCLAAEKAGADRIELVSDIEVGGLSPTIEMVRAVTAKVSIPVNVMVRFKSDNFRYEGAEVEVMLEYIKTIKKLGINGIVFGGLDKSDVVDNGLLNKVVECASGLDVTFHRAIDENQQKYKDNFTLINGIVTTVLTSGGTERPIDENIELLASISHGKTKVLVGGGIKASNYQQIMSRLLNCDFHIGSLAYNEGNFAAGINSEQISEIKKFLKAVSA